MSINFNPERWARVKETSQAWWAGELKRPLIQMTLWGREPARPKPRLQWTGRDLTGYRFDIPAADIVDRWDYNLSCCEFLGDAFPNAMPDLGPGVIAAFIGGRGEPDPDTVWFHPAKEQEIADITFRYEADNALYQRLLDIYRACVERWQGAVQVGTTDLGGNLDILSTFRPGEKLLLDLYDAPAEVKRLTWSAHELWWRYFEEINALLQPVNPGYTAWAPIFSAAPYYMLQCDFCYMIGPEMFDEFIKPKLVASCKRLTNPFYHLDGIGQLPHLDSLLTIPELKGIQWVPGDGQAPNTAWPEVYRKIRDAGKLIQTWGNVETMATLAEQLGSAEGIIMLCGADISQRAEAEAFLQKYGA